jgi:hypothetical protein
MRAYSATGASALWEWLIFEHNQHQVEEARALAKELNFQFVVKNPLGFGEYDEKAKGLSVYNKEGEYEYSIWPANHTGLKDGPSFGGKVDFTRMVKSVPILNEFSKELEKTSTITCKSIERKQSQEVYISATGYMLPCCFLGGVFGQFNSSYSRYQFNTMINDYGLEVFNLNKKSMLEIIKGPEFSKFFLDGWKADTIENGKLLFCLETCGNKSAMDKLYVSKRIEVSK